MHKYEAVIDRITNKIIFEEIVTLSALSVNKNTFKPSVLLSIPKTNSVIIINED